MQQCNAGIAQAGVRPQCAVALRRRLGHPVSNLKLRYDRIRMGSMFMVGSPYPVDLACAGGYSIRHRRGGSPRPVPLHPATGT